MTFRVLKGLWFNHKFGKKISAFDYRRESNLSGRHRVEYWSKVLVVQFVVFMRRKIYCNGLWTVLRLWFRKEACDTKKKRRFYRGPRNGNVRWCSMVEWRCYHDMELRRWVRWATFFEKIIYGVLVMVICEIICFEMIIEGDKAIERCIRIWPGEVYLWR